MSASALSKKCCSLPSIVAGEYATKGTYESINEIRTYITGSTSAKIGVIFLYDAFGYASQTLQGADLLASTLNAQVFMPDPLEGGMDPALFPIDTEEKKKIVAEIFGPGGKGNFERCAEQVVALQKHIQAQYPSIDKFIGFGLCWGGKVVITASNHPDNGMVASAQGHPSRLSKEDAEKLVIPHLILASKDEPVEDVKAFDAAQKPAGSEVHTYPSSIHGWMGARANLSDDGEVREYKRAYEQLADWISEVV